MTRYYGSVWKKVPQYVGNITLLVIYTLTFIYVMYLMKKLHQYEFHRNRKSETMIFFVVMIFIVIMNLTFCYVVKSEDLNTQT